MYIGSLEEVFGSASPSASSRMLRVLIAALLSRLSASVPSAVSALPMLDRVHAFYYLWYGTPPVDGRWVHWDHHVLPHWTAATRAQFPDARFLPPHDVHSPFFPARGLYSSRDEGVMRAHFEDMRAHGVGVAVISWWGRPGVSAGDSQGVVTEGVTEACLRVAQAVGLHLALHLEPYEGRDAESLRADLAYLHGAYGAHPALLRVGGLPLFYIYDSYHVAVPQWQRLLTRGGDLSIRGGDLDVHALGLWLEAGHGEELRSGGFDGAYTYFATDGFSYGATTGRWADMAAYASASGLSLSLSVAPGYDDSKIRPWNAHNTRGREGGAYYARMWEAALGVGGGAGPDFVSVTTYNEWGEGTQIEGAVPKRIDVDRLAPDGLALNRTTRAALRLQDAYEDYEDAGGAQGYMAQTRRFAERWGEGRGGRSGIGTERVEGGGGGREEEL